jgi:cytochrome c-type biogenesis protein CcmH
MNGFKLFRLLARALFALIAHLLIANSALSATDPLADRMHRLTQELRCLVCQNESLADSHAPLAMDLKRDIRAKMAQGESDDQIRDFLRQRYGDFVNYNPPFQATTLLLWGGPLLLLAGGALLVWRAVRGRAARGHDASDDAGRTP